jgi:hypothetical protein
MIPYLVEKGKIPRANALTAFPASSGYPQRF